MCWEGLGFLGFLRAKALVPNPSSLRFTRRGRRLLAVAIDSHNEHSSSEVGSIISVWGIAA